MNTETPQPIETARKKYRPEHVKLLLIAEAPPRALNRFFYYEKVKDNDWLYLGVAKVFTNSQDPKILRANKKKVLNWLKDNGVYLMDLSDSPLTYSNSPLTYNVYTENGKKKFMDRLKNETAIDKETTNIILIKASVYDFIYRDLEKEDYKVSKERIPFPASGQQKKFDEAIRKALKDCCWDTYLTVN